MSGADGPWRPTEHGANIGHSSAWMAHRKVALDVHRMLHEDDPERAILDAPYTVMALRQVLRGVEMTRRHLKSDAARALLGDGLAAFDLAVPGGKEARDVIEHFDEYAMGVGRLQQPDVRTPRARRPDDALSEKYNHRLEWDRSGDEPRPVYVVGPYRIDLVAAEDAAFRLHCDAYEALLLDEGNPAPRGWAYQLRRGARHG
ncbi:hypothetical protein [Streptomyces sp. NBC_00059]|uniref:hypothetical protein n=1 Tax=Streptomyces sp. NBC_00059 TaxID=2975635 RepID=UPI00225813C4|nr:hypothetical protein [Streptomyces sp. NBC_00059]MCX5415592.1 hypothetical protein [Streptomyces sp. NBC_00059]